MKENKVFWCKNCLNMSTRPRIGFDERGWCNACVWMEKKTSFDFSSRENSLKGEIEKAKKLGNDFDCVVPVSGGKDGSYVLYFERKVWFNPLG